MKKNDTMNKSAKKSRIIVLENEKKIRRFDKEGQYNPKADFKYKNWSGTDFRGCDLRGYDFTGANLSNCRFNDALVEGAIFDLAILNNTKLKRAKDWAKLLLTSRPNPRGLTTRHLPDFSIFQDQIFSPEMIVIPGGEYLRGSPTTGNVKNERPQENVTIPYRFAVGRFPVTFYEWDFALKRGGCDGYEPPDSEWGHGLIPVNNVSWKHAKSYIHWLNKNTGEKYRLLSEAEWEYCARAGTQSDYYFGNRKSELHNYAWYSENSNKQARPVGQKRHNRFGLHDMLGNVWEWCEDHWHDNYHGAPLDGRARILKGYDFNIPRILRGGSWNSRMPENLRCASRSKVNAGYICNSVGFRIARTLND